MGCFFSSENDPNDRCQHCRRRAVNNLVIINHQCEYCISEANKAKVSAGNQPRFGWYRCSCGHTWESRLSRTTHYQQCIRCKQPVYAYQQRELRATDRSDNKENLKAHRTELCQMCRQLGRHCGVKPTSNVTVSKYKHKAPKL